jgi:hypothetical protein
MATAPEVGPIVPTLIVVSVTPCASFGAAFSGEAETGASSPFLAQPANTDIDISVANKIDNDFFINIPPRIF